MLAFTKCELKRNGKMKLRSKEWPVGHLLNPATPYVKAANTDVRVTIARARRRIEAETKANEAERAAKVRKLAP